MITGRRYEKGEERPPRRPALSRVATGGSYPVPVPCLCVAYSPASPERQVLPGFARSEPSQPLNERPNNRLGVARPPRNPFTNTGRSNSMYPLRTCCKRPKQWNQCDWHFSQLVVHCFTMRIHIAMLKENKTHCVL